MIGRRGFTLLASAALAAPTLALSAPALALSAPTAHPHALVFYGANYAFASGGWLEACDRERDGNGVYAEGWLDSGGHVYVWDGNGSAGGCGHEIFSSRVARFRVCEDHSGCSSIVEQSSPRHGAPRPSANGSPEFGEAGQLGPDGEVTAVLR